MQGVIQHTTSAAKFDTLRSGHNLWIDGEGDFRIYEDYNKRQEGERHGRIQFIFI